MKRGTDELPPPIPEPNPDEETPVVVVPNENPFAVATVEVTAADSVGFVLALKNPAPNAGSRVVATVNVDAEEDDPNENEGVDFEIEPPNKV